MSEKHYISWWVKEIQTANWWHFFSMYLKLEDLASCNTSDKWYIKLNMSKRKEPDAYWNTHYIVENDWKPDENQKPKQVKKEDEISVEDIPF